MRRLKYVKTVARSSSIWMRTKKRECGGVSVRHEDSTTGGISPRGMRRSGEKRHLFWFFPCTYSFRFFFHHIPDHFCLPLRDFQTCGASRQGHPNIIEKLMSSAVFSLHRVTVHLANFEFLFVVLLFCAIRSRVSRSPLRPRAMPRTTGQWRSCVPPRCSSTPPWSPRLWRTSPPRTCPTCSGSTWSRGCRCCRRAG